MAITQRKRGSTNHDVNKKIHEWEKKVKKYHITPKEGQDMLSLTIVLLPYPTGENIHINSEISPPNDKIHNNIFHMDDNKLSISIAYKSI